MPQLFARVFTQILDSSLAEDWQTRHVFEDLLKLADEGIVDMTRQAISRRTNIPLDVVSRALDRLESPDPASRDPKDEGRRIKRLDAHRDWGWEIVNWEKYESWRNSEHVRESARLRKQKSRAKMAIDDQPSLPLSSDSSPSTHNHNHTQVVTIESHRTVTSSDIWELYPRKVVKVEGIRAIEKAMKKHNPAVLIEKVRQFSMAVSMWSDGDKKFIPYPATWFNQERFLDDPSTWTRGGGGHPSQTKTLFEKAADSILNNQYL